MMTNADDTSASQGGSEPTPTTFVVDERYVGPPGFALFLANTIWLGGLFLQDLAVVFAGGVEGPREWGAILLISMFPASGLYLCWFMYSRGSFRVWIREDEVELSPRLFAPKITRCADDVSIYLADFDGERVAISDHEDEAYYIVLDVEGVQDVRVARFSAHNYNKLYRWAVDGGYLEE